MIETAKPLDILPDSRARGGLGAVPTPMGFMVPVFCPSCGAEGGWVPEENMTFVCWMCQPCIDKYGHIAGTMLVPDQVFFERVKQEQIEKYGRVLSAEETVISLANPDSLESKLARDRVALTPKIVR